MNGRELIEKLEAHDTNKPVLVYREVRNDQAAPVAGIDSYEDALVLVPEWEKA